MENLVNYLRAGFPAFWIKTDEPERFKSYVYPILQAPFKLSDGSDSNYKVIEWDCLKDQNPMTPLKMITEAEPDTVIVMYNYHWFIEKPVIIQTILNLLPNLSHESKAIIIVSAVQKIPVELKKHFKTAPMPLPGPDEIKQAISFVAPDEKWMPNKSKQNDLVRVSRGLTQREIENIFSLSLIEKDGFDINIINDYRSQIVKQSGLADILSTDKTFKTVIGYQRIKDQVMETIFHEYSKGIIAIGPTGTGKTSIMQAIANESGKLAVKVRTGKLMSKFQGESDKNVESLIEMLNALGDCLVLFDEFEKQFSGVGGSGQTDGGTTVRIGGQFLEWFEDTPKGIYRTATCNTNIGIPPEYFRPGRWDSAPWYVDLPNENVKHEILKYYIKKFSLKPAQVKKKPAMPLWTGAEIEALCKNAAMRNKSLVQATEYVLPMAAVAKEDIATMREWAKGRTTPAENEEFVPLDNGKRAKRKIKR